MRLEDGRTIAADVVLVAVGVAPDMRWLAGSPLEGDGIAVDQGARTLVPNIYAAGDVARPVDPLSGARIRCEHWAPAGRRGGPAARARRGGPPAHPPPASFWSDQYGLRVQLVGEAAGADSVELDGDPDERDFTAVLRRRGELMGALLVGRPRELPTWRRRLAAARTVELERSAA